MFMRVCIEILGQVSFGRGECTYVLARIGVVGEFYTSVFRGGGVILSAAFYPAAGAVIWSSIH
jgi:hypothetical protein